MMPRTWAIVLLGIALAGAPVSVDHMGPPWSGSVALADDDDVDDGDGGDGGDDGDDDGSSGGGSSGGGSSGSPSSGGGSSGDGGSGGGFVPTRGDGNDPISRWLRRTLGGAPPTPPQPVASAPATSPRPVLRPVFAASEPDEIIAFDLGSVDLARLIAQGFTDRETTTLTGLGVTLHRLGIAPGLDLATARAQVQALPSGQIADLNHFFRPEQATPLCMGERCPDLRQVGWQPDDTCAPVARMGMIDTAVNTMHETLAAARIDTLRTAAPDSAPADAVHGTAVAALLVGANDSRLPGLLPRARLTAVDAFHAAGRDTRADAVAVLKGLSHLAESRVDVVNLSLAGPPNALLDSAIARLAGNGMVLAAAAGNAGPDAPPSYPAAYDPVIAVTAVDSDNRIYRRAQTGAHVDLAAPGVGVWSAASIGGLRQMTGTSFAVPYVTAALARLKATHPAATPEDLRSYLAATAQDLGEVGHDPVFGHGLLSTADLCDPADLLWTAGGADPAIRENSDAGE